MAKIAADDTRLLRQLERQIGRAATQIERDGVGPRQRVRETAHREAPPPLINVERE